MRLVRIVAAKRGNLVSVRGDFKSAEGKRLRLSLGPPVEKASVPALMDIVFAAAPDIKKLREVGGV